MRRSLLLSSLLAGSALLGACATTSAADPAAVAEQTQVVGQAATGPVSAVSTGKPQIGTFGFDEAGMDRTIAPGDDFYAFANGTWEKTTPIPADKSNFGMFTVLEDLSRSRTREILDGVRTDANSKIGVAYATYLDQASIDAKGLAPIQPWLGKIKALSGKAGYAALAAEASVNGIEGPFGGYVGPDDKHPDVYALNLSQSGLGLPDRDYYLSTDAKMVETRNAYVAHIAKMFTLAGEPNAQARAAAKIGRAHV